MLRKCEHLFAAKIAARRGIGLCRPIFSVLASCCYVVVGISLFPLIWGGLHHEYRLEKMAA